MTVAEVIGDEVIVTLPLTSYTVTYYKPARSPQLLAKRIASRDMLALEASGKSAGRSRRPKERSPALGSAGLSLGFQRGLRAKGQVAECRPLG